MDDTDDTDDTDDADDMEMGVAAASSMLSSPQAVSPARIPPSNSPPLHRTVASPVASTQDVLVSRASSPDPPQLRGLTDPLVDLTQEVSPARKSLSEPPQLHGPVASPVALTQEVLPTWILPSDSLRLEGLVGSPVASSAPIPPPDTLRLRRQEAPPVASTQEDVSAPILSCVPPEFRGPVTSPVASTQENWSTPVRSPDPPESSGPSPSPAIVREPQRLSWRMGPRRPPQSLGHEPSVHSGPTHFLKKKNMRPVPLPVTAPMEEMSSMGMSSPDLPEPLSAEPSMLSSPTPMLEQGLQPQTKTPPHVGSSHHKTSLYPTSICPFCKHDFGRSGKLDQHLSNMIRTDSRRAPDGLHDVEQVRLMRSNARETYEQARDRKRKAAPERKRVRALDYRRRMREEYELNKQSMLDGTGHRDSPADTPQALPNYWPHGLCPFCNKYQYALDSHFRAVAGKQDGVHDDAEMEREKTRLKELNSARSSSSRNGGDITPGEDAAVSPSPHRQDQIPKT